MNLNSPEPPAVAAHYDPNALPVAVAQELIAQRTRPVTTIEKVALRDALDRVIAADLVSPIDVPAHDNSAMDGYAFDGAALATNGEVVLSIVGRALAGRPFNGVPTPGQCVRIMTGALIPPACDTVIPQEQVRLDDSGRICFQADTIKAGHNRRAAGEDLAVGRTVLGAGRIVRASDLGLLASLGIAEIAVRRRLRVAFFSTGDELRSVGEILDAGCVYDSNRYTLFGMLRRLNVDLLDMGIVRDSPEVLDAAFREAAASADVVITSGGVSVGEADLTRQLMNALGEVAFWKIAMRPGRPLAFGHIWSGAGPGAGKPALLFALPGNPVAVMVTFYHFVRAALLTMMGAAPQPLPLIKASSTEPIRQTRGPHGIPAGHRPQRCRRNVAGCVNWSTRVRGTELDE